MSPPSEARPVEVEARISRALVECSEALLGGAHQEAINRALRALLEAAEADAVFVDVNLEHPELGFCMETRYHAVSEAFLQAHGLGYFGMVPWSTLPAAHNLLSAGGTFVFEGMDSIADTDRPFFVNYAGSVGSELAAPVFVRGEWAATVGIDTIESRTWQPVERTMLETVARMFSAFWERETHEADLLVLTQERTQALLVSEALLECSQVLLSGSGEADVDRALDAIVGALGASSVYVDVNIEDPDLGSCMKTIYRSLGQEIRGLGDDQFYEVIPWSELPGTRETLASGGPVKFSSPAVMDERERKYYAVAAPHVRAEISVPMMVGSRWIGSVGVTSRTPREWEPAEIRTLETVARMFVSHLERSRIDRELRDLLEAKDRFIASVSHELRTPLTAVVGFLSELQRSDVDEETRSEMLDIASTQAVEVGYLIEDLLVAARSEHGGLGFDPQPMDPESVVFSVLQGLPEGGRPELTRGTIEPTTVMADSKRVRQIIRNLLVNVVRHGGGQCRLDVETADRMARVRIADSGPGIPAEHQESVFEAYRSAGSTNGPLPSIGLGLTVSRQLARLMGGDVVYEADGESAFVLSLPLAAA